MEGSVPGVYGLVNRALLRLRLAALGEAVAAPAAALLLAAGALLAAARASGRTDLPRGLLAACAALAFLAAAARLVRLYPSFEDAALHLDRSLEAGERFTTVVETAARDPAVAEWAARGALERATGEGLRQALALRPPAALLPLLLAGTVVAGLALLPAPPAAEPAAASRDGAVADGRAAGSGGRSGAGSVAAPAAPGSRGASPATGPAPAADAAAALDDLEARARGTGNAAALREVAAAREALARGDDAAVRAAMARAVEAAGGSAAAGTASTVPGATGGGEAAAGPAAAPRASAESFRPLPVPLRAREAVRNYFGAPKPGDPR